MPEIGGGSPFAPGPETGRETARRLLAARLRAVGIASADADARILVCAACGIDHAGLIRDPDLPLGAGAEALAAYAARRVCREPVSRILGRREFWGLPFVVEPAVLDPRPETEGLVDAALAALGGRADAPLRILDLGTGSGIILCALLRELPFAWGLGLDRSAAACMVAARNVVACELDRRAAILCGDWAAPIGGRFDVVVSNPPYIPTADIAALDEDVRRYDPAGALDGGPDGLAPYRAIVPALDRLLRPGGIAALECGRGQGNAIALMMRDAGLQGVMVRDDLAGIDRVVLGTAPL